MCGISGVYSTTLTMGEKNLFKKLLMLNVFRGEHSTGVVKIRNTPKLSTHHMKAAVSSPEFIFSEKGGKFLDDKASVSAFIGHCRYATKGKITPENAHPFSFQNVIGVHNGTIKDSFKFSKDFETDSEALYALINEVGIEDALNQVADSDAAYALVYFDKREGTLNFIRNSKRPLFFSYVASRSTLAWSSTKESIDFAVDSETGVGLQQGWDPKEAAAKHFFLKPYDLLSVKIGNSANSANITTLKIREPETKVYSYSSGWEHIGYTGAWIKGSDGNYRTREDEEARLEKLANISVWNDTDDPDPDLDPTKGDTTPEVGGYKNFHKNVSNLSELPWLERQAQQSKQSKLKSEQKDAKADTSDGKKERAVTPGYGSRPLSPAELNYKLTCGCFACGLVVNPMDAAEVARVRWWSRDFYACGDCYEGSDGNWVKHTVDDTWEDFVDSNPKLLPAPKTVN